MLVSSDADGGSYQLFMVPKDGRTESQPVSAGPSVPPTVNDRSSMDHHPMPPPPTKPPLNADDRNLSSTAHLNLPGATTNS